MCPNSETSPAGAPGIAAGFPPPAPPGPARTGWAAWRRLYFRRKLAEDAALFVLRRLPGGRAGAISRAMLDRIHRQVLQSLRALPPAEPGDAPRRLGVAHHETFVAAHDPIWTTLYDIEAASIRRGLDPAAVEVHHIGSTAVPGLAAKPIIDIGVGLPPEAFDREVVSARRRLSELGYRYLGDREGLGGHYLEKGAFPLRTHAIQLHPSGGPEMRGLLHFRDELRAKPRLAAEYQAIKQALAAMGGGDRRIYLWCKSHWLNGLLRDSDEPWSDWLLAHPPPSLYRMRRRRLPRQP
jgi:GrpB-like predicted nucleotidyltransferase (UPF0157 family)